LLVSGSKRVFTGTLEAPTKRSDAGCPARPIGNDVARPRSFQWPWQIRVHTWITVRPPAWPAESPPEPNTLQLSERCGNTKLVREALVIGRSTCLILMCTGPVIVARQRIACLRLHLRHFGSDANGSCGPTPESAAPSRSGALNIVRRTSVRLVNLHVQNLCREITPGEQGQANRCSDNRPGAHAMDWIRRFMSCAQLELRRDVASVHPAFRLT